MEKKRFKMYKAGKNWVVAPIVFFGMLGVTAAIGGRTVSASENVNPYGIEDTLNDSDFTDISEVQVSIGNTKTGGESQAPEENTKTNEESLAPEENTKTNEEVQVPEENTKTNEEVQVSEENTKTNEEVQVPEENTKTNEEVQVPELDNKSDGEKQVSNEDSMLFQKENLTEQKKSEITNIPIYRVYNPNSGEHFLTTNSNEKDYLVSKGWRYEGISSYIDNSGKDLYRVYNPNSGEHFFTIVIGEKDNLVSNGWRYEGIAWKVLENGIPMYRLFDPKAMSAGSHLYTENVYERDHLVKNGWRYEGIGFYTLGGSQGINYNALGVNQQSILNELNKHSQDNYYLGTPYYSISSNNAEESMKPGKRMNCTGFVASVIRSAGGSLNKISEIANSWGGVANAYNWAVALSKLVTSYTYNTVSDMLSSGKAKKGDIIYFVPDYSVANYDCHIGFFWGDNPNEDLFWHSAPAANKISNIYAPSGYSKVIIYSM